MIRHWWVPELRVVVALLVFSSGCGSAEQYRPMDEVVADAIVQVASRSGRAIDPVYAQEMTQSAMLFASNFCYGGEGKPHDNCLRTIYEPAVLAEEVQDHFADIEAAGASVLSLGARLAIRIGDTITRAGWPEEIDNRVAQIRFNGQHQVGLVQDGSVISLGNPQVALFLPGNYRFRLDDGTETNIVLGPRESANLESIAGSQPNSSVGRLTPLLNRVCRQSREIDFKTEVLAPFNWGRSQILETESERASNLAPVLHDRVVSIGIIDQFERCNAACRAAIATAFARAILTWRAGCDRCDPEVLTAVKVDQEVWLDTRLMDRLRTGGQVELKADEPATNVRFAGLPADYPTRSRLVHFDHLSDERAIFEKVCSGALSGSWVVSAREEICTATTLVDFQVTLLGPGELCNGDDEVFACAEPGGGVRVALDRVSLSADGEHLAGSAQDFAVDVVDLAVHEVGHWFGVPHTDIAGQVAALDIMSATYGEGQLCLGGASAAMMISAADLRWPHRLNECAGWRKPRVP